MTPLLLVVVLALQVQFLAAATLQIQFTGLDIVYDGSDVAGDGNIVGDITDATDSDGGDLDPAKADPINTVTLLVDGELKPEYPTLTRPTDDLFADFAIFDVANIPVGGGDVTTPSDSNLFDLILPGMEWLALDLDEVTIGYTHTVVELPLDPPVSFSFDFIFGGTLASIDSQNLPYGLEIGDPVTVSFSTQIVPGTLKDDGTYLTGFAASGTGEIRGVAVPEPTSILLLISGLSLLPVSRRQPQT